jgi:hypothetical protein
MIGQRIEGRPGFPIGAVIWFTLAAAVAIPAAVFLVPHAAIFAALPAAIGVALLIMRDRAFDAELTPDGLEIDEPRLSLPYSAVEGVVMPGKPGRARAPIYLVHAGGVVRIPKRLNVRSDDLYAFLLDQLPPSDPRDLPESLARYRAVEERHFGPERVFSFRARPHRVVVRRRTAIAVCLLCVLAGVVWILAGALLEKNGEPWIVLGGFVAFMSLLFALAFRFEGGGGSVKNWQGSALVISPSGLAMIQGELRGELRWDELRDIRAGSRPAFFEVRASGAGYGGITLVVSGATIVIADVYDRPLALIEKRLRAYWFGGGKR